MKTSEWRILCLPHREDGGTVTRHYFVYHARTGEVIACDDLPHAESVLRQKDGENDLRKWLQETAELRKRLCDTEKRSARKAARKEAEEAKRREAFWQKHPDLRPR